MVLAGNAVLTLAVQCSWIVLAVRAGRRVTRQGDYLAGSGDAGGRGRRRWAWRRAWSQCRASPGWCSFGRPIVWATSRVDDNAQPPDQTRDG